MPNKLITSHYQDRPLYFVFLLLIFINIQLSPKSVATTLLTIFILTMFLIDDDHYLGGNFVGHMMRYTILFIAFRQCV